MWWYNLGMYSYARAAKITARFKPKAKLWVEGRKGIFDKMRGAIKPGDRIVWIHSASLGEFEQGRPIIEAIRREHPGFRILLTFFSPSGYEIRKDYDGADYIFYLPMDTPANVRKFLDIAHPEIAIFIKYEFWLNYLTELGGRGCRTFIVSAIFRKDSIFFRPYGGAFRKALRKFEHLFVQDERSRELLAGIDVTNVTVAGDTRFDRVAAIAAGAKELPIVDAFVNGGKAFVAGSTWPPDEELLIRLINDNPGRKFIVAPHEIDPARIDALAAGIRGGAKRYTQCGPDTGFSDTQVLFIDTIGILSSVYRYGDCGYIGGGFGAGIHNTLEAATFGLPLAFGPNYQKFKEARDLIATDAAQSITSYEELSEWYGGLCSDPESLAEKGRAASGYVRSHTGATGTIVRTIFGD